jgi:predicted RecA/RadA family phage recombinase
MQNENVKIKLKLNSTTWNENSPYTKVWVDNLLIYEGNIQKEVEIVTEQNLTSGKHVLAVEMLGKKIEDTKTDNDGNILNDMLLHIKEIEFDEIDLALIPWNFGVFAADTANIYAPREPVEQIVDIGWNGTWRLEFESPIYLWLLENIN